MKRLFRVTSAIKQTLVHQTSDLNVTTCNVTLLTNSGIIRATKYGKLLIVDGYVTISGQNENKNVEIAKINGIVLKQQTTQFLAQIGNAPISPYCTFGSMRDDGTIVVYSPLNSDSLFRFGFATITR